jgi:hypothetical protein
MMEQQTETKQQKPTTRKEREALQKEARLIRYCLLVTNKREDRERLAEITRLLAP